MTEMEAAVVLELSSLVEDRDRVQQDNINQNLVTLVFCLQFVIRDFLMISTMGPNNRVCLAVLLL